MNVLYIEAFAIKLAAAVALFFLAVWTIQQRKYPWNIIVPLLWVLLVAGWAVYGCTPQQSASFMPMMSLATSDK
jgi:carbon starvation protein CstA